MFKINKRNIIIIIGIAVVLIVGGVYYLYTNNDDGMVFNDENLTNTVGTKESEDNKKVKENKIIIHVAGHVKNPGVLELVENSRISDAIEKAGGLLDDADISNMNLAYVLEDGIKIYIPSHNEVEEEKKMENEKNEGIVGESTNDKKNKGKININSASKEELESLPGIGSATAEKIINYRKENGKFSQIEDVKSVKGIGNSKFESIKDFICVK